MDRHMVLFAALLIVQTANATWSTVIGLHWAMFAWSSLAFITISFCREPAGRP